MEKEIKKKHKNDFDAIKAARLEKEVPVLEGFWAWFEKQHPAKGSRMEKAITYNSILWERRVPQNNRWQSGRSYPLCSLPPHG